LAGRRIFCGISTDGGCIQRVFSCLIDVFHHDGLVDRERLQAGHVAQLRGHPGAAAAVADARYFLRVAIADINECLGVGVLVKDALYQIARFATVTLIDLLGGGFTGYFIKRLILHQLPAIRCGVAQEVAEGGFT
jgi:hypothetical protein